METSASFLSLSIEPRGSVAARRIPAGCRAKLSVSNPSPLQVRVAERRNSQPRNAATVGLPCGETHPVSGRDCRSITRTGAPLGAPLRLFLKPRDRLLKRTVTTSGHNHPAGISPCVHPLHQPFRTDPRSWAGRCLSRPPEVRLRRPNPQAPHPAPPTSATGWRPLLSRTHRISSRSIREASLAKREIC